MILILIYNNYINSRGGIKQKALEMTAKR